MGVSVEGDKVSMRDVLDCAAALEEDFPWQARIVLLAFCPSTGRPGLYFRAQACDRLGRPDESVAWQGAYWPSSEHKTVSALLYSLLLRLYIACDIASADAVAKASAKQSSGA